MTESLWSAWREPPSEEEIVELLETKFNPNERRSSSAMGSHFGLRSTSAAAEDVFHSHHTSSQGFNSHSDNAPSSPFAYISTSTQRYQNSYPPAASGSEDSKAASRQISSPTVAEVFAPRQTNTLPSNSNSLAARQAKYSELSNMSGRWTTQDSRTARMEALEKKIRENQTRKREILAANPPSTFVGPPAAAAAQTEEGKENQYPLQGGYQGNVLAAVPQTRADTWLRTERAVTASPPASQMRANPLPQKEQEGIAAPPVSQMRANTLLQSERQVIPGPVSSRYQLQNEPLDAWRATPQPLSIAAEPFSSSRVAPVVTSNQPHETALRQAEPNVASKQVENRPHANKPEIDPDEFSIKDFRAVQLMNLPPNCTARSVAKLVYGGPLEEIEYETGATSAVVLFLRHEDCVNYCSDVRDDGIKVSERPRHIVSVDMYKPVPITEETKDYIARSITRCVRLVGIDDDFTIKAIIARAQGMKKTRRLEHVTIKSHPTGPSTIEFNFLTIRGAVAFTQTMQNDPEWNPRQIEYFRDHCDAVEHVRYEVERPLYRPD